MPKKEEKNMAVSGISTLGVTFGYASEGTAGQKPTAFTQLTRINSIGGITIENEQIDASALEDMVSRYIQGRGDTGGSFAISVNYTPETGEEWKKVIEDFKIAQADGKRMWFETIIPGFDYLVIEDTMVKTGKDVEVTTKLPVNVQSMVGNAD